MPQLQVQTTRKLPYLVAGLREQSEKVAGSLFPESHLFTGKSFEMGAQNDNQKASL